MHDTTASSLHDILASTLAEHISTALTTVVTTITESVPPPPIEVLETTILAVMRPVLAALLTQALTVLTSNPPRTTPCVCGTAARYLRTRSTTVMTSVGTITVPRATYRCPSCRTCVRPADHDLHLHPGSRTAHLTDLLALLGSTRDSFAAAAMTLERLTGLHLSPTTVRQATHEVGADLVQQLETQTAAISTATAPPTDAAPPTLVIALDGGMVHEREHGWRELKIAAVWTRDSAGQQTTMPQIIARRDRAEMFGEYVWATAATQGAEQAEELVVIGDGAHWIWNLAATQFPQATEIVDWYHVTQTLWRAAHAMWPDDSPRQHTWMQAQETALWAGDVAAVQHALADLQTGAPQTDVDAAVTYLKNHQHRMAYATYRDRGLPCGSGRIESTVKQVVTMRLKGPGMRWSADGVARVAHLRAVLLSKQWETALAQRPWQPRPKRCGRPMRSPAPSAPTVVAPEAPAAPPRLDPALCAAVRADLAPPAQHPWKRPWSMKRQRELADDRERRDPGEDHANI